MGQLDLLVIGGGAAGLVAALAAADEGAKVVVLSKGPLFSSNSYFAQGGVAAALGADDSPALHAEDTLIAGRGLCRESAVAVLTAEAPARIAELERLGVEFESTLAREGGHQRRRIVHAGGAETGRKITERLAAEVLAHPGITVREGERALALWCVAGRCAGAIAEQGALAARATLLASGGYAALWERTTNPPGAVGDGLLLAYRAGAALADLELVQFHPTALLDDGFLLSEALRGDGALLLDLDGARFTDELAPRDVVARAIAAREQAGLDLRPVDRGRYPGLIATLERAGYDPAREPVPVAPAAHYTIGGIVTDLEGRTSLPGLYAAGEVAATGVHGANRLASNSLLECLVFGRRAALAGLEEPVAPAAQAPAALAESEPPPSPGRAAFALARCGADPGSRRARAAARRRPPAGAARRPSRAPSQREPRRPLPQRLPTRGRGLRRCSRQLPAGQRTPARTLELTRAATRAAARRLAECRGACSSSAGPSSSDGTSPRARSRTDTPSRSSPAAGRTRRSSRRPSTCAATGTAGSPRSPAGASTASSIRAATCRASSRSPPGCSRIPSPATLLRVEHLGLRRSQPPVRRAGAARHALRSRK